jgi:chitin synthase
MSNILDKPFQSVLGYISVLPGAFSAYRYVALAPDDFGRGPLDSYFKGEKVDMEADVFEKNMYLAEDRILCWELVARRERKWLLKYVSEAWGETDCPDTVAELIGQRRRWLNGATFAATFALWNFRQIWHTSHSKTRKFFLHIEFVYQAVELLFTFFGLANFYLTFYFITQSFGLEYHWASYLFVVLRYLCIMVTAAQFILALGNRPKGARALFMTSLVVYAFIMAYTLFCALFLGIKSITTSIEQGQSVFSDKKFANVVVSGIATSGVYFISSIMYLEPWHCFTSFGQYMILLPFYLCTLTIFAFCNIHDLSWGTKEEDVKETDLGDAVKSGSSDKVKVEILSAPDVDGAYEDALTNLRIRKPVPAKPADMSKAQEDYFKEIRSRVVLVWLVCNLTLMMSVSEYYRDGSGSNAYLSIIMYSVVLMTSIRFAGSIVYLAMHFVQTIGVRKSAKSQVVAGVEALKEKSKILKFWSKDSPSSTKA